MAFNYTGPRLDQSIYGGTHEGLAGMLGPGKGVFGMPTNGGLGGLGGFQRPRNPWRMGGNFGMNPNMGNPNANMMNRFQQAIGSGQWRGGPEVFPGVTPGRYAGETPYPITDPIRVSPQPQVFTTPGDRFEQGPDGTWRRVGSQPGGNPNMGNPNAGGQPPMGNPNAGAVPGGMSPDRPGWMPPGAGNLGLPDYLVQQLGGQINGGNQLFPGGTPNFNERLWQILNGGGG